jgi:hypothetical protein
MSIKRVSKETVKGQVLHDLARPRIAVVQGGDAATDLTATGLKAGDHVVSAILLSAGVQSVITDEVTVTADDTIQVATTATTGDEILVTCISA